MTTITGLETRDARFSLPPGAGSDAVHAAPEYSYAVTRLTTATGLMGTGLALTLGAGNELVCQAITTLGSGLIGMEIETLMSTYGQTFHALANHHQLRWLGPQKGVIQLALASLTNAAFDLWARSRGLPLWQLLLSLTPEQVVALLDLAYLEDALTSTEALEILHTQMNTRALRSTILAQGYPGYDTSAGWFGYDDAHLQDNARSAVDKGFRALKLKVGSAELERDVRRAHLVRAAIGDEVLLMVDANQQWSFPLAIQACKALAAIQPYWVEEPTHPDDVLAHQHLVEAIAPLRVAIGEHVPNAVLFKNYMEAQAVHLVQVDCTRVGGVSEFLTVSLLARKFGLPVVPHVGDMGQIHQHLVLFNHIALGHEALFLEYIPHLRAYFQEPADVRDGVYYTPRQPGSSTQLLD
ncbi:MAG TPA: enolase C-terminal domain-like protein [Ktedonobacterales bacterium]|nr:enolase C-terminal domain-like protein [Ktedonobacterales bacterium]